MKKIATIIVVAIVAIATLAVVATKSISHQSTQARMHEFVAATSGNFGATPNFDVEVGNELYEIGNGIYYDRDNASIVVDTNTTADADEVARLARLMKVIDPHSENYDPSIAATLSGVYTDGIQRRALELRDENLAESVFQDTVN